MDGSIEVKQREDGLAGYLVYDEDKQEWVDAAQHGITMGGIFQGIPPVQGPTGGELIPADVLSGGPTGAAGTVLLSSLQIAGCAISNFRNLVDGGDFQLNPFQRGTSFTSNGGAANSIIYTADRWYGTTSGTASGWQASQQANTEIAGFTQALRFGRVNSATNTNALFLGQIIESADAIKLQGQMVALSFYAECGANFSSPGSALAVRMFYGTGTNQSAASGQAGTWSGFAFLNLSVPSVGLSNILGNPTIQGQAAGNPTGITEGAILTGNSTAVLTTSMQRFTFVATVPTSATQLGFNLSFSGSGTVLAAASNDYIQLHGVQLEIVSSTCPFPTPFEHRDVQVELEICQRYAWVINEPTTGVSLGVGAAIGTNSVAIPLATPVQMRSTPTVTVVAGAFVVSLNGTDVTFTGLTAAATHTSNVITIVASGTVASNFAVQLRGGNGAGKITASADL